jgi:hypothetical protein
MNRLVLVEMPRLKIERLPYWIRLEFVGAWVQKAQSGSGLEAPENSEGLMTANLPEVVFQTLKDLRRNLLHLHKVLLDAERAAYERVHGVVSVGELLQLVINDEQFAWLHTISELIVRIDETLDTKEPATAEDAKALVAHAQGLLRLEETGTEFQRKYYNALQREPDALIAHREVMLVFQN